MIERHCVSYIHALIYIVKAVQTSQGRSHQYSWSSFNWTTSFLGHQNCFLHTLILAAPPADLRVQLSSFKVNAKMAHVKTSLPGLPNKPHHPKHFAFPNELLWKCNSNSDNAHCAFT